MCVGVNNRMCTLPSLSLYFSFFLILSLKHCLFELWMLGQSGGVVDGAVEIDRDDVMRNN